MFIEVDKLCTIGQIVYSKSGRDKGRMFFIVRIEGEYLYLADGDLRKLQNPKKKKQKHVQIVNKIDYNIKQKLEDNAYLKDSDIRNALQAYKSLG